MLSSSVSFVNVTPMVVQSLVTLVCAVTLLWWFRTWVVRLLDLALAFSRKGLRAKLNRNIYLKGPLFAPVHAEIGNEELTVSGDMPAAMNGVYVRVGANPFHKPTGGYHWFDGDGMTHAVRIKNGKAAYSNRFVDTYRLRTEKAAGYPVFPKIGDMEGAGFLVQMALYRLKCKLGIIDRKKGAGRANTAVVFHARRLLALEESDMPYALRMLCDGAAETLGRMDFGGKLQHAFTAHPKTDPVTGELFGFCYSLQKPYAHYTVVGVDGGIKIDIPIDSLAAPRMMHDCALTSRHFIFMDLPLCFEPKRIFRGELPFAFDKTKPSRFGLLPRYATDESDMVWFELPAMFIFHTANAWEEDGGRLVKLAACCFDEFDMAWGAEEGQTGAAEKPPPEGARPRLHIITLDRETGLAARALVSPVAGDFPTFPLHLLGRKTRYTYLATLSPDEMSAVSPGITKLDMEAGSSSAALAGEIRYGEGVCGGEAFFVAADADASLGGQPPGEDDGYLVTYLTHRETGKSQLAVFDAKTMDSTPLATVPIPQRVPAGFHGIHIKEAKLRTQAA